MAKSEYLTNEAHIIVREEMKPAPGEMCKVGTTVKSVSSNAAFKYGFTTRWTASHTD